jgi:hypothetical protein
MSSQVVPAPHGRFYEMMPVADVTKKSVHMSLDEQFVGIMSQLTDDHWEAQFAIALARSEGLIVPGDASVPGSPGYHLHEYWTKNPKGLAKWVDKPHPWTALYHHLLKYIHNDDEAKATAAKWFHDVKGFWPGDQKGKNPVGPG